MRRATTPTHTFTFPQAVKVNDASEVLITYSQCGNVILEKTLSDLTKNTSKNAFTLILTQKEANLFTPGKALIQLRAKMKDGAALVSQMIWLTIKPALDSKEL